MSRLNKVDEIIELAILMQNSYCGISIDGIAEKFECSHRSAERMKALIADKFPDKIEEVQTFERKKRWRFKKGINFLINLTSNDFANLEYCKNLIGNSTKQKELKTLIEKLKVINSENTYKNDIDTLLDTQGYAIKQHYNEQLNEEILNKVKEAILSQKQIKIIYKAKENILNPLGIMIADKQYLVAFNTYYNEILNYRLAKIENLEILENYFEKDEDFNLQEYVNSSFGVFSGKKLNVVLEFDKSVKGDVLEYGFHPSQKIKELKNGNVCVSFAASGSFEIITELLKWRDTVKIISPKVLKDEYRNTITAMYKNIGE